MITVHEWVAIAALIATSVLWYYLGKEVGYGEGYKAGERHAWRQIIRERVMRAS